MLLELPPIPGSVYTRNMTSCRHDRRMPVLNKPLGDRRSLVLRFVSCEAVLEESEAHPIADAPEPSSINDCRPGGPGKHQRA